MSDLTSLLAEADQHLGKEMVRKEGLGAKKYGEFAFLENPTLEMAMDEIVDLMNYARYTYRKLYIMNEILQAKQQQTNFAQGGFVPTTSLFGDREQM